MFSRRLVLLFIALLSLSALHLNCTHHLVPGPQPLNATKIPDVTFDQQIRLENTQNSMETIRVGKAGLHTYNGNLNEWTEKTIKLLSNELRSRGAVISDDAEKVLRLAVIQGELVQGAFRLRGDLTLQVETGDGYKKEFFVQNLSGGNASRATGGAITLALTDMLNDQNILEYLK